MKKLTFLLLFTFIVLLTACGSETGKGLTISKIKSNDYKITMPDKTQMGEDKIKTFKEIMSHAKKIDESKMKGSKATQYEIAVMDWDKSASSSHHVITNEKEMLVTKGDDKVLYQLSQSDSDKIRKMFDL